MADFLRNSLSRVEIQLIGRPEYCTDVRAAMSGIADPETGVQISVRAPTKPVDIVQIMNSEEVQGCKQ